MAWSFVGTSATVEALTTPLTLTEPAGVANGDLLIATISSRSTATTAPTATGWTAVGSQNNNSTVTTTSALGSGAMLYQIRSGTPTLAFTLPATVSVAQGRITAYRGVDTTTPFSFSPITPTSDAYGLTANSTTYATAREATIATTAAPSGTVSAGQQFSSPNYNCRQYFMTFNTSSISASATSAILSLNTSAGSAGDVLEIREVSSSANMIAGSSLGTGTLLGSFTFNTNSGRQSYLLDITSMTRGSAVVLCLSSQDQRLNTAPSTIEVQIFSPLSAAVDLRPVLLSTATTAVTTATNTLAVSVTGLTTTAFDLIVAMTAGGQEATWTAFGNVTTPLQTSGAVDTTTAPNPTAWIKRAETVTTSGADTSLGVFDAVRIGSGATGNLTVTASLGAGHVVIAGAFKAVPGTADAWNGLDALPGITLSNSDKTATTTIGTTTAVRSTQTYVNGTTGKYYAEYLLGASIKFARFGITATSNVTDDITTNCYVAMTATTIVVNNANVGNISGTWALNDVCCVAFDAGAKLIWFRRNGTIWNNDAAADPATGTNGISVSGLPLTAHALWTQTAQSGAVGTIRTELAEYTQTVPSGFKSWMGETASAAATSLVPIDPVAFVPFLVR